MEVLLVKLHKYRPGWSTAGVWLTQEGDLEDAWDFRLLFQLLKLDCEWNHFWDNDFNLQESCLVIFQKGMAGSSLSGLCKKHEERIKPTV